MHRLKRLIHEVHRRSLWQVLLLYLAGAWAVLAVVDTLAGALGLPDWAPRLAFFLLVIGLPIVLGTAFVQEGPTTVGATEPDGRPEGDAGGRAEARADGSSPGPEPPGTGSGALGRLFTWRNALLGGLTAFALWGVVAAIWLVAAGAPSDLASPGEAAPSSDVIAVFPFSVQGSRDFEYLGDGIVNLLSTKLDGAGEYRSADPRTLLSLVDRRERAPLDPSRARGWARDLGAGLVVLGSIVEAGGSLRVAASVYPTGPGEEPLARAEAEGRADAIFRLVDQLAAELLGGLSGGPAARITRIAAVTTHSLSALKAYLEGERQFRRGDYQGAVEAFQRATAEDSAFALAYYRLSIAAEWNLSPAHVVGSAAEKAAEHADRLAPHDRQLLSAFLATRRGAAAEAERLYRAIIASYPEDFEAWFQLAEVLFHYGPVLGGSIADSREAWERMLEFAPDEETAMIHLARIAATSGDRAAVDSLTGKVLQLSPGSARALEMSALRAFALADSARSARVVERFREAPAAFLPVTVWSVASYSGDPSGARRLAALMTEQARPDEIRALGRVWMGMLDAARGRWRRAETELGRAEALFPTLALEHWAWLALVPFRPDATEALQRARSRLEAWDPSTADTPAVADLWITAHRGVHEHIRLYALGSAQALLDRPASARETADRLAELPDPHESETLSEDLSLAILARIGTGTDPAESLARLDEMRMTSWYNLSHASGFFSQAHERFLRAQLLEALGRTREAERWYASLADHSIADLVYLAPSHLRRARLLDEAGDGEGAVAHYRAFIALWRDADPELQPRVREAEARLEALLSAGG